MMSSKHTSTQRSLLVESAREARLQKLFLAANNGPSENEDKAFLHYSIIIANSTLQHNGAMSDMIYSHNLWTKRGAGRAWGHDN